jgi:hypothetical protein
VAQQPIRHLNYSTYAIKRFSWNASCSDFQSCPDSREASVRQLTRGDDTVEADRSEGGGQLTEGRRERVWI